MRKLMRRGVAFLCAVLILCVSIATPVYAEEDANTVSFSKLASAAAGFLSDAVAHETWVTDYDGVGHDGYKNILTKVATSPLKAGNAGGLLGYPDESNCGGVVWDWLASRSTTGSVTYSYSSLLAINELDSAEDTGGTTTIGNPLAVYAYYGYLLNQLGLDSSNKNTGGNFIDGLIRSIGGGILGLMYQLSNVMNAFFGRLTKVLQMLNPFSFFGDVFTATMGDGVEIGDSAPIESSDDTQSVSDALNTPDNVMPQSLINMGYVGDVLLILRSQWTWFILIPLFFVVLLWNLLVAKNKNKGVEIKKFVWRVFTMTLLIALLGSAYTEILSALGKAYGTVSPATKVIMSTYFDFQSWVEDTHMQIPSGEGMTYNENFIMSTSGEPQNQTVLSVRSTALQLNLYSLKKSLGDEGAAWASTAADTGTIEADQTTVEWNQSMRNNDFDVSKESSEWVSDLLNRYGKKAIYQASDWEAYYKNAYLDYSNSDDESSAGRSLANIIQHTDDALDWKKIGDGENSELTPGKQLIINNGSASFTTSSETYQYNNSPNPWNVATAYVGTNSIVVGESGELTTTGAPTGSLGYLTSKSFYILPSNNCLLSPMSIYNYLNTSFTSTGLVVYSPALSSNDSSREFHNSVNLVGDESLGFLYGLNALVLMGCLTVLSLFYFFQAIFSSIRRTLHLVIAMPMASLGSLRFAAKLIYHAIMLVAEVVVTMLLYSVVTDLLVSLMTILESVFAAVISSISSADDLAAATEGAETAGSATQLLNVNSGTILFSGLNTVPMASDTNFVFGAKALEIITVLLSIIVYVLLTIMMIKYRKVVVKGVDEMVGDWTTAFVPGARQNDMNMPDSKVAANFDRAKGAAGAALGAGVAAGMASRGLEADKSDMEGDTESVDNDETDVNAPTTVNTQAGEDAQGGQEEDGSEAKAENQTMSGEEASADAQDKSLARQLEGAQSLGDTRVAAAAENEPGAITDENGDAVATSANGQTPQSYDSILADADGDRPDDMQISDDDMTHIDQNISNVDDPDLKKEALDNAKNVSDAAGVALLAAGAKGEKHGLSPEDKRMLANQTEDAAENQIEAIRKGHEAAGDALGRELNKDEKEAATLGAAAAVASQDGMNKKAAEAGVKSAAAGPMSQEQMDKLTAPILDQLSEGALTQAAVQDAVEDGMRRELGRDLTAEEKEQAKQVAADTIAKSKEAASDRGVARAAALEGAKAVSPNGELTADQAAAALKAADAAMDKAEAAITTENLAAAEAVRAAKAANGGKLSGDQQAAVEQQAKNTVANMEKAAIASAEKANGGKLTDAQLKAVKDSVASKAIGAAATESVNMVRASKGQMPMDAKTEGGVRALAARNAANAKAAVTGANAAAVGAKAGAESVAGTQMTVEQEEQVAAVSQEQVAAAEQTIAGSTVAGMAGAAAVAGVSQIAPGKSQEELSDVRAQGEKRGNTVMQRNRPISQTKKAGGAAAVRTQRVGMAKPGMTSGEARFAGEKAAVAETSGIIGTAVTVAARNQTVTQQQQMAAESGGSRVTRTGATSYQDADGTGTNFGGETPGKQTTNQQAAENTQTGKSGKSGSTPRQKDSRFVRISASQATKCGTTMQQSADAMQARVNELRVSGRQQRLSSDGGGYSVIAKNAAQLKKADYLDKAAACMQDNAAEMRASSNVSSGGRAAKASAKNLLDAAEKTRKQAAKLQKLGYSEEAAAMRTQATQLEQRADTLRPGSRQHRQNVAYMKKVALFTYMSGSDSTLVSALGQAANMGTHINFWQDMESQRAAARNGGFMPDGSSGTAFGSSMAGGRKQESTGGSTNSYRSQAEAENKARWSGKDASGRTMNEDTRKMHAKAAEEAKKQARKVVNVQRNADATRQRLEKELEKERMARKTLEKDKAAKPTDGIMDADWHENPSKKDNVSNRDEHHDDT